MPDETTARMTAFVRGQVQGVGFRWWVRSRALELGLAGSATNLSDGRVEVIVEGPRYKIDQLLAQLDGSAPGRPGFVMGLTAQWSAPRGAQPGFTEA
jgi:acylphosphatase